MKICDLKNGKVTDRMTPKLAKNMFPTAPTITPEKHRKSAAISPKVTFSISDCDFPS